MSKKKTKSSWIAWLIVASFSMSGLAATDSTSESSSMAFSEAFTPTPVGKVPPENSASPEAVQELLEVSDSDMQEALDDARFLDEGVDDIPAKPVDMDDTTMAEEEPMVAVDSTSVEDTIVEQGDSWFTTVKNWISSNVTEGKARAKHEWHKRRVDIEYGEGSSSDPNFTVIREAEAELKAAAEKRQQRELALEVERQNQLKLYNESLMCMALNGYYEARGETADQEVASGAVVLNRLSVGFRGATTVCEVVYSPKQFSWVDTHGTAVPNFQNKSERKAWERSVLIAKRLLDPDATYIDPTNGAVYYYNPSIVDWKYAPHYVETAVLGNHRFMREKKGHKFYIDNSNIRINPVLFNGLSHKERDQLKKDYEVNRSE